MLEEFFKNAEFAPSIKAFINGVPVAVFFRQESPLLRTGTSHPQHGFKKTARLAQQDKPKFGKSSKDRQNLFHLFIS